jgi:hypothetical protein
MSAFAAQLHPTDYQVMRDALSALAQAIGWHDCRCGESHELAGDATFADYAELQRWIGYHDRCTEVASLVSRAQRDRVVRQIAGLHL